MKKCTYCNEVKPLSEFGKHKAGKDGLRSRCKPCEVKINVAHRKTPQGMAALKQYRAQPHAKDSARESVRKWLKTDAGKATKETVERRFPKRRAARRAVRAAVESGRLIPLPCLICGSKAEAHHPDYDAPLAVVWLCSLHHRQAHELARQYSQEIRP